MDLALVPPRHHAAIGRLFKRLDPISGRRRGRPATFRIHEVVSRCVELLKEAISENAIAVTIQTDPGLPAHGYEQDLQAALLNIIDNAVYWLSTVSSKRTIDIAASYDSKDVVVNVSNNGPTLGQDYIPRLFSAGFTLKAGGTGLGLAIAREAMRGSKGDIAFDDSAVKTTFVRRMPAAPSGK